MHGAVGAVMKRDILIVSLIVAFLFVLIALAQVVAANTTYLWTTTADFDSGSKAVGDAYFASNGRDQPMYAHITNPSAMYANGRTYIVWQSSPSWLPYITYYDHATAVWATPVQVSGSIPGGQDGHGSPSVYVTANGYIHVMYGSHQSTQEYSRSSSPYDISTWTTMADPVPIATYPNLWEYGGRLYLFYRRAGLDLWTVRYSTDNGDSWSAQNTITDFSGAASDGAYFGGAYSISPTNVDRIYMTFVFVSGGGFREDIYAFYLDLDTLEAFSVGGTNLGTTISEAEANASLLVRDTPFGAGSTVIHVDPATGNPWVLYSYQIASGANPAVNINMTRWTGAAWSDSGAITNSDTGSNYLDFIVTSGTDVEAFITGSGIDWIANADEASGDMQRWTYNGATWTFRETIMREAESGKPVNHPEVPLNFQMDLRLVFDEFGITQAPPHDYVLGLDNLKLYGWGSKSGSANGFAYRMDQNSGNLGVETVTDNARVAPSNAFALARFPDDPFDVNDADGDTWKWNFKTWDANPSVPVQTFNQREVTGGAFNLNITSTASGGESGLVSPFSYTGDFDIWFRLEFIYNAGTGSDQFTIYALNLPVPRCEMAAITDGIQFRRISPSGNILQTYTCSNAVLTQQGTDTAITDTTFCLRVRRVGDVWTTFYSLDGTSCTSWVTDETFTFAVSGGIYPAGIVGVTTAGTITSHYRVHDAFLDPTGTTYRAFGTWETPIVNLVGQRVTQIIVNHTGLSATNYIDRIDLLVDNASVFARTDDIISGTATVLSFAEDVEGAVSVRITLVSDGNGTPIITELSFDAVTTPVPDIGVISTLGWVLWVVLTAVGVGGPGPFRTFLIFSGMLLIFLSIRTFGPNEAAYMVIGIGASIFLFVLGVAATMSGGGAEA